MNNFESIVKIVQPKNKKGGDKLRELHFKINRYIFRRAKMPMTERAVKMVVQDLKIYVRELENLDCSKIGDEKKNEMLGIMKGYIADLAMYEVKDFDLNDVKKTLSYRLSEWIKGKERNVDDLLDMMKMNKWVHDAYVVDNGIENRQFNDMQKEISDKIFEKLKY